MDAAHSAEIFVSIYQSHSVTYQKTAILSHRWKELIPYDSRLSELTTWAES
jgi:hypothetical protein